MFARAALFAHIQQTLFNVETIEPSGHFSHDVAITALCFKATIDDPTRFKRSRSVGAYVGLSTRRHASGKIDWTGRISKCGDAMLRSYLFEAAGVLLTRVPKWSALKLGG